MQGTIDLPITWSEKLAAVDQKLGDGLPFGVVENWIDSLYDTSPEEKAALFLRAASVDRSSRPLLDELLGGCRPPLRRRPARRPLCVGC